NAAVRLSPIIVAIFLGIPIAISRNAPAPGTAPTRLSTRDFNAPIGSLRTSVANLDFSLIQSIASPPVFFTQSTTPPPLYAPNTPPDLNAIPMRARRFISATAAGPPTARVHSGRMIASPPESDRRPRVGE